MVTPDGAGAASTDATPGTSDGATPGTSDGAAPDISDEEELEHLRAEVSDLRTREAELASREEARRPKRPGWRAPVATVLIVIGCLLAPVAVLGVWTANQVSNTDRYVANIEPLIHDPAIQNALTDKITTQITTHLNVAGYANQAAAALTSRGLTRVGTLLKTFAPSIASAIAGFIHTQVHKIVTSPGAANVWLQVNRVAHAQLVKVLSGQGNGAITTSNGQVILDLGPFINIVKQALVKRGLSIVNSLPPIHPTIALFSSKTLVQAQTLYRLINNLKWVL